MCLRLPAAALVPPQFQNYGQCNNLKARAGDMWWDTHINSFAMRQIAAFENHLGWAFWTYKLGSPAQEQTHEGAVW